MLPLGSPLELATDTPGIFPCKAVAALEATQDDPASYQGILDRIPEGRWGTPDDLVGPVLLLVSDAADYVNGIVMPIDGGYLAR